MLTTLNGMFSKPKPHRLNFIKENKRKLKEISSMVNQNSSKSRFDVTKSRSSQTEIKRISNRSFTGLREKNSTSACRLGSKGSMAVFLQEKKDKGSISCVSVNQRPSSKVITQKNQSCQTIDPRRCDQLYHEGVIIYPSKKIMQELAEIEKQKANRLDAHVKKEFFKRNKVRRKSPNRLGLLKSKPKTGKGDEGEDPISSESEEEVEEEKEKDQEPEPEPEPEEVPPEAKQAKPAPVTMRAAEIIKRTSDDLQQSPRMQQLDHTPGNKGDSKQIKRKKSTKEEAVLKTVLDPQCPPGHIPLPDTERRKTLHMLRVSHAELVREMNLLPVRTDTLRIRQKKIQLENQLNKIEEGIKVFNKSKVYVKIKED